MFRFAHFFIDRPIFASVLSVFITLMGLGALAILPVAQYPEMVPPMVQITTTYPDASAETVSRTVTTPLEQQINGVENMLYMSSQSTGDDKLTAAREAGNPGSVSRCPNPCDASSIGRAQSATSSPQVQSKASSQHAVEREGLSSSTATT